MSQVFVFPRGQLSELDKARMEEVGIIAVEADDPGAVVAVIPCTQFATGDDLLQAAMTALTTGSVYDRERTFVTALAARIQAKGEDGGRDSG